MQRSFEGTSPEVASSAYVDPEATLIGDVVIEADATVLPGAVLRADGGRITLREAANVQDNAVVHADADGSGVLFEERAAVGHCGIVHNATVGHRALVGMNATVLDNSSVGDRAIVAAGSVVTEDTEIEPRTLVGGTPASVLKADLPTDGKWTETADVYVDLGKRHARSEVVGE